MKDICELKDISMLTHVNTLNLNGCKGVKDVGNLCVV